MKTKILMALLAGTTLFAACSRSGSGYEVTNASAADSASVDVSGNTPAAKLIKTAEIRFKVKDVTKSSSDISALTVNYNGMVMHHQINSSIERSKDVRISNDSIKRVSSLSTTGAMTVKVPSEKLEQFMTQVSQMGLFVSMRRMDIEDRTLDYLENKMKLESRSDIINRQKKGSVVIKRAADVMMLKDDIIDQKIGNRRIDESVKFSIVNLNYYQSNTISTETIANDDPSAYNLPFFNRIGLAITNGWTIFKEIIIAGTNLWVLILLAVAGWIGIRRYKRKNTNTAPASA